MPSYYVLGQGKKPTFYYRFTGKQNKRQDKTIIQGYQIFLKCTQHNLERKNTKFPQSESMAYSNFNTKKRKEIDIKKEKKWKGIREQMVKRHLRVSPVLQVMGTMVSTMVELYLLLEKLYEERRWTEGMGNEEIFVFLKCYQPGMCKLN